MGESKFLSALCSFLVLTVLISTTHASRGKPVILAQPRDTVVIGFSFTLMCITAKNNSVTWYHNGRRIQFVRQTDMQKTADGSLHVSNAIVHRDEGYFQCLVSNSRGTVFSRRANVNFPFLKQFSTGNTLIGKEESHSVVLRCQPPASFPNRQIQWSKLDPQNRNLRRPLPQSTHYTVSADGDLHFAHVESKDSGDYMCTVTNNIINKHVVRTVALDVMPVRPLVSQPPMISAEFSRPKVALKGKQFVLECIVYGMPVPKITLRMRGVHMILGHITGNARRLFIKSFTSSDAGKYKCKATDSSGRSDSRNVIVKMEAKPEWIKKPRDTTAGLNSNATLSCKAYGIPGAHYQWYYNGKYITASSKYSFSGGNLLLSKLQYNDGGMYQCVVTNTHGQLVSSAELVVAETPAGFGPGSKAPQLVVNKLVHSTATLTCNPTGNPKPYVRWRKGSTYLGRTRHYNFLPNGDLQIVNVTKYDTGRYTCEVSNRLGKDSRTGRLNVQNNLAITTPPRDKTATLGSTVRFTCGVSTMGVTEVTIEWSRYYIPIIPNSRITTGKIGQDISYVNINGVRFADAGLYSCKATAPLGSVLKSSTSSTALAFLQVQGPPDPPKNVAIQDHPGNLNSYHVNVTWSLGRDNFSPIIRVLIEQRVYFTANTWTLVKVIHDPRQTRAEMSLSPWAQFSFRVIAVNRIGRSKPSAESPSVSTPADAPEIVPRGIRSKGKTPTSMLISWKPLRQIEQNGQGIYYIVYYKMADSKDKMTRHEIRNNRTRFTIRGTDYFVKYAFQVQAANKRGFGPKSDVIYGFSGERYPVGRPTRLNVQITSPTSAFATWTPVANNRDIAGGKLLGYKVYYWSGTTDYRPRKTEFKSTIRTSSMVELDAFTSYRFQVVAYNSRGDGPGSNVVGPLNTPMAIPGPPSHLTLIVQNRTYVVLRWTQPKKPNGVIISYAVSVRRLVDGKTVSGSTNFSNELRVHNLNLKTKYQFSVQTKNKIGLGPPVIADFDLATIPLRWPLNVRVSYNEFQREALISWEKITELRVDGYRIFYWRTKGKVKSIDVERDRSERAIPRLLKGEEYQFQVAAFNLVDREHYAIGPRSPPALPGKSIVAARKSGCSSTTRSMLLLESLCLLVGGVLYWIHS